MKRSLLACSIVLAAAVSARGDLSVDFSTNPLTDASVLKQGPDAANLNNRFVYNSGAGTLTAHYDTALPTLKLVFPFAGGQHFNQDTSFVMTTRFQILATGFVSPDDFGGQTPGFGLVNSVSTGSVRASTSDASFSVVTDGDAYNLIGFDYFPTQDNTFGGNSVTLTTIQSPQAGTPFNSHFVFDFGTSFLNQTLPFDQFITATLAYDAATHLATLNWGAGSVSTPLTGAIFDVDSFAITLWNDPNLTAGAPAVPAGSRAAADVVFDSFTLQAVPEPASLAILAGGLSLLMMHRRRS